MLKTVFGIGVFALICVFITSCGSSDVSPTATDGTALSIVRIEALSSGDTLTGFLITGTGFEEVMTAKLSDRALAYEFDSETLARAYLGHTVAEGTHVLSLAKRGEAVDDSVTILRGRDGRGISWQGSLESAPANPDTNWAYHNSLRNTAYIWDGSAWQVLIEGFEGVAGANGISILWQGTHAASPPLPEENWAYYNSTDGVSYIYTGTQWDTMALSGADGAPGADGQDGSDGANGVDGISIIWQGMHAQAPTGAVENWVYYNSTDGVSYIFTVGRWDTLSVSGFDYSNQTCPQGYQLTGFDVDGQIVCSENPSFYYLTYDSNGATGGTVPQDNFPYRTTESAEVAGNPGGLTGGVDEVFVGWNTEADASGDNYAPGDLLTFADRDMTLYARFGIPAGMVFISGGTFDMGSTTGDPHEQPVHSVTVSSFFIDTTEVTQKQYSAVMSAAYIGFSAPSWTSTYGVGDSYPAHFVNWYDAVLYCNALTKAWGSSDTVYSYTSITGTPGNDCVLHGLSIDVSKQGYRLPTEAEWEYACRGGTTTVFYWGDDEASTGEYVWYWYNSGSSTHPVAQKLPNAYGLYDMSGNVGEWCNDWYGSYSSGSATNPTGPSSGLSRVMRGGGWDNTAPDLRSASRSYNSPDSEYYGLGIRVVLPAQ